MPTHRPSLDRLNVSELAEITGFDRRTVKDRLRDLVPVETTGRELRYDSRAALRALQQPESGRLRPPVPDVAESVRAFEMEVDTPHRRGLNVFGWREMVTRFDIDEGELREWLRFGCPYLQRGDAKGRGWEFSTGHVLRWIGLWFGHLERMRLIDPECNRCRHVTRRLAPAPDERPA